MGSVAEAPRERAPRDLLEVWRARSVRLLKRSIRSEHPTRDGMRIEDMVDRVVSRFIGTKHERDIKKITPKIAAINELAGEYEKITASPNKEKSASLKFQVTERLGNADPA